jgi:hypothetical protein
VFPVRIEIEDSPDLLIESRFNPKTGLTFSDSEVEFAEAGLLEGGSGFLGGGFDTSGFFTGVFLIVFDFKDFLTAGFWIGFWTGTGKGLVSGGGSGRSALIFSGILWSGIFGGFCICTATSVVGCLIFFLSIPSFHERL